MVSSTPYSAQVVALYVVTMERHLFKEKDVQKIAWWFSVQKRQLKYTHAILNIETP
jgi:hypothetical protein